MERNSQRSVAIKPPVHLLLVVSGFPFEGKDDEGLGLRLGVVLARIGRWVLPWRNTGFHTLLATSRWLEQVDGYIYMNIYI